MIGTKDLTAIDKPQDQDTRTAAKRVALKLGRIYSAIGRIHWDITEAESSLRKREAGYRDPDPSTGREREHFGIDAGIYRERLRRAEAVLTALETTLPGLANDLPLDWAGLETQAAEIN